MAADASNEGGFAIDPMHQFEITRLIVAQRAYEMNSKVITAADEMLQALNQSA